MYKSIQRETGEEVISLSPEWRRRLSDLRALDRADLLVCQACRQPVRLKAGLRRRPHFAHKHLKGCSLGNESPAVVEARGALYERLVVLFPDRVELEKPLEDDRLPRGVDLLVRAPGGSFALWVVDTTLKLEARDGIRAAFESAGLPVVWVLCARMLHPEPNARGRLRLSPTERDFLRASPYDEIGMESRIHRADFGATLHYLDAEKSTLTTYRSLERVHAPNVFAGRVEHHPLDQVLLDPNAPDWFHPGETGRLNASRAERFRRVERIQRFLYPADRVSRDAAGSGQVEAASPAMPGGDPATNARRRWQSGGIPEESRLARCIHCGNETEDWWQAWWDGPVRRCKCRACLEKGLE